jgi:glycosyltransferase involved in cell wall biosynthesis
MHAMLYGPGEAPGLLALDPRLVDRVHVNPFGVDTRFWIPAERDGAGSGVLAIGNDGHRDWETLVRAAPAIAAEIRILTKHAPPASLPANVRWEPADWHRRLLDDAEIRSAFRGAAVVVVPVKDVPQPSGQSVTLQASACARPVVLSRTRGLWDPDGLRNGENVVLVPPGDPDALGEAVARVLADPALGARLGREARTTVETRADIDGYAGRLLEVCARAVRLP